MASKPASGSKRKKPTVLGRSPLTGQFVYAPVVTRQSIPSKLSDKRIAEAVKRVLTEAC